MFKFKFVYFVHIYIYSRFVALFYLPIIAECFHELSHSRGHKGVFNLLFLLKTKGGYHVILVSWLIHPVFSELNIYWFPVGAPMIFITCTRL